MQGQSPRTCRKAGAAEARAVEFGCSRVLEQIAQPGIAAAQQIVEAAQAEFDKAKLALDEAQRSYKTVAGPLGYARSMKINSEAELMTIKASLTRELDKLTTV